MQMSFGKKKGAKKRGPAAAFTGEDEEDAAKSRAQEVQRQRALELGMSGGAAAAPAARPPVSAVPARPAPAAVHSSKPAKKAADYSSLVAGNPAMVSMGLPMAFGSRAEMNRQKKKTAAQRKGIEEPVSQTGAAVPASGTAGPWSGPASDDDEDEGDGDSGDEGHHTGAGASAVGAHPSANREGDDDDDDDDDEAEEEYSDDEDEDPLGLPMAQSISLQGHSKRTSALAVDAAGSRCFTGSYDNYGKFWDFNGMNQSLQSFRQIEPWEGHQVRSACYAPTGGFLLIACHKPEASIHDRDGKKLSHFVKGDPYVCDMIHTKGHIGPINAATWHPTDMSRIITCAGDGSVRLWDSEVMEKQVEVIKVRNARGVSGKSVMVSTCNFSDDGKLIAAGVDDGTLQVWSCTGTKTRPHKTCRKAHGPGEITGVSIGPDGHTLASRSFDGTMKVWDLRKFTKPLATFEGLSNFISETDCVFSPNGRYIMTGTSVYIRDNKEIGPDGRIKIVKGVDVGDQAGRLVFVDPATLSVVREVPFAGTSVLRIRWHAKLNQIFTSLGDGSTSVHYTKGLSQKGALYCATKQVAKKKWNSMVVADIAPDIKNPHALPMYKDEWQKKKQIRRGRDVIIPAHERTKPQMGYGPEAGNKTASTFTSFIMKSIAVNDERNVDPREAFLRHAKDAEANPTWVSKAYAQTQPKTVFTETTAEQEEEASKKAFLERK